VRAHGNGGEEKKLEGGKEEREKKTRRSGLRIITNKAKKGI